MDEIMFPGSGKGRRRSGKGESLPTAAQREQEDLFGKPEAAKHVGPVARSSDPETSHTAARKAGRRLGIKQLAVLETFQLALADGWEAYTHERLVIGYQIRIDKGAEIPHLTDSSIRTRCSELVTLGYVEDSGSKGTTVSGGESIMWQLTESGRALDVEAFRRSLRRANSR